MYSVILKYTQNSQEGTKDATAPELSIAMQKAYLSIASSRPKS